MVSEVLENNIYNIDCINGFKKIKNDSINLIITSPPYNVDIFYDSYKDNITHQEWLDFMKNVWITAYDKLKNDGRIIINIGDKNNGKTSVHSDLIQILKEIGYTQMTTIIWNKNHVNCRTAWGSFMSPSSPSFPSTFEYILVFCKNKSCKLEHKGEIDLTKEEFVNFAIGMWNFAPEKKLKVFNHPAMFPEELPYRCIKMFTYVNDLVCDPFNGSGTTTLVSHKLNRKYIGFDISEKYCQIALQRINEYKN